MKIQECIDLLGKHINDEKVVSFIEAYGYKYPKKDKLTNRSGFPSYWVEHKKLKVNFICNIESLNPLYQPLQAQRKGSFYPFISAFYCYDNKTLDDLPVDFSATYDELVRDFGEPTLKSSQIAKSMYTEDEGEAYIRWHKVLDEEKQIELCISFSPACGVDYVAIRTMENNRIIRFFYEMNYENHDTYLERFNWRDLANKFFIRWLIEHKFVDTNYSVEAYIASLNRGYFGFNDIVKYPYPIRRYVLNMNSDDEYLINHFLDTFVKDNRIKDNTEAPFALDFLNAIEDSDENYNKIKTFWNKFVLPEIIE